MAKQIFRQAALQHLNVAERLDTAVRVVTPGAALVTGAAAVLLACGIVWAVAGRVPTRVYGDGILLQDGQVIDVTSMADGQVGRIAVTVGSTVQTNDVIAFIEQPELKKQQTLLQGKAEDLAHRHAQLEALAEEGRALKQVVLSQRRSAVARHIKESRKQLTLYEKKLSSESTLLDLGLTTPGSVADTRQKVLDMRHAIEMQAAEQEDIAWSVLQNTKDLTERKFELASRVNDVRRELDELEKRIEMQSKILAKAPGRILELKITDGDAVVRGRSIATLEAAPAASANLVAQVYIQAQDGKRVEVGMPVKLAPSVIKPEEDGYLDGIVESISAYPVSEQSMLRAVRNESLVTSLLKAGPVYEARVRVRSDEHTPSGLRWTNGRGPRVHIAGGTPVRALVTVRTRRPIELVLPALQRVVTDTSPDRSGAT